MKISAVSPTVSSLLSQQPPSPSADPNTQKPLPDHLLRIPGKPWAFWKWACLRGAGFPAHLALALSTEQCAAAADALFQAERRFEEKKTKMIDVCRAALAASSGDVQRKQLSRVLRQLYKGNPPDPLDEHAELRLELVQSLADREMAASQYKQEFQTGVIRVSHQIRSIARDPQFRQAVLLQNREAILLVTQSFQRQQGEQLKRGSKDRQHEELIANYLQRYCMKNDTVGFFGPVGWARLEGDQRDMVVRPGQSLVVNSSIFFENWCIEALASDMAADASLQPWIVPRLLPFFHVEDGKLYGPSGRPSALAPSHAVLLKKCQGVLTAREIVGEMMAETGITTEAEVWRLLGVFASREVIAWKFEIPICIDPEHRLRGLLERIEDESLRRQHLQTLDRLEERRKAVAVAVGDAESLDQALVGLDETFRQLTGKRPTKSAGAMYAARTLIYQDCRRDVSVQLGTQILSSLGVPLSLLLLSARWFSYRVAAVYREAFHSIYEDLCQKYGKKKIDLLQFWGRAEPLIFDPETRLLNEVLAEFQRRWEEVLQIGSAEEPLQFDSEDLRPKVESVFFAPHAGWKLAQYHSPDVMIAASSVEAIRRGDYRLVLGEIHITNNTIRYSFTLAQHPEPEQLLRAVQTDLPEPHVLPLAPRHWPRVTNRTTIAVVSAQDFYLEISPDNMANAPRSQALPIASLVLTESPTGLVVQTRDGRLSFDVIEFMSEILSGVSIDMMKIARPRPHQPRITIDRLVVSRESWSFLASTLPFMQYEDESQRYLEVRRWMLEHKLPRFVFVRVPVEIKPFYVDFSSPVYVEILVKMIRRMLASKHAAKTITVSEMLPAPGQLWLPDSEGNAYSSEFRMVVRDLVDVPVPAPQANDFVG
jgi:hypothetical protein